MLTNTLWCITLLMKRCEIIPLASLSIHFYYLETRSGWTCIYTVGFLARVRVVRTFARGLFSQIQRLHSFYYYLIWTIKERYSLISPEYKTQNYGYVIGKIF
jgi:hypothetical protein